ncbi:AarF/ABC1/UbiB kinase family protein [Myxococcota bacterium]|nr:AarF/ABC1/UbiB kinase family protein [Myxococcota bacterium]
MSASPPSADVVRSLPRRAPLVDTREEVKPARMTPLTMPLPPTGQVLARVIAWMLAFARVGLGLAWDRLTGQASPQRQAERVSAALRSLGGCAVQVGRQLSMRLDLLPIEIALELLNLRDQERPFPVEQAIERIEAAGGQPLDALFEAFDPTPLASSSLSSEYQAVLRSGAPVVVRVRRPHARERYAVELAALSMFTRTLERLTILRQAFLETLRVEMSALITDELDFRNQARYQSLFRKRARRDRLRKVSAARVHHGILSDMVLVSDFISGVRLSEVIGAVGRDDRAALATLASMNIEPKEVGRRLWEVCWWGLFENQFFDAEPNPDTIVVQPGGALVFVGFGEFFTALGRTRRTLREVLARLAADDVSGSSEVILQALAPLPFIDTHAFSKHLEARVWQSYFAMQDRQAPAHERSTASLTMAILLTAGQDGVPVRSDLASMLRSLLLYDTFAMRVHPNFLLLDEFAAYLRRAERRAARRFKRKMRENNEDGGRAAMLAGAARGLRAVDRLGFWVESMTENLPISNLSMTSKASYVLSELLALVMQWAGLIVGLAALVGGWRLAHGVPVAPWPLVVELLEAPLVRLVLALTMVFALRRVQFRLLDKDPAE